MLRYIANIIIILQITINCYGSCFYGLKNDSIYEIILDGIKVKEIEVLNGMINYDIPQGGHNLIVQFKNFIIIPTSTPIPTINPTPTPTQTEIKRRPPKTGKTVVSLYDSEERKNKIEVLSSTGTSLFGNINVLSSIEERAFLNEGKENLDDLIFVSGSVENKIINETYDYNGDFVDNFEINFEENIVVKDVKRYCENDSNHFLYIINSGSKTYFSSYSEDGFEESKIELGDDIEFVDYLNEDINYDGIIENYIVYSKNNAISVCKITSNTLENTFLFFGNGYDYNYISFANINDDSEKEIVLIARSKVQECFRLIVSDKDGKIILKKNLLTGKFEDEAMFIINDLDNDGKDEFVISGTYLGTGTKVVQVVDDNNKQLFARSVVDNNYDVLGIDAININEDENKEILVLAKDSQNKLSLNILDVNGQLIDGYLLDNLDINDLMENIIFSKDIDSDGFEEVFMVSYLNDSSSNIINLLDNGDSYNKVAFSSVVNSII